MRVLVVAAVCCAVSAAHAEPIAIVADEPLARSVGQWFQSHGREVVPSGLSKELSDTLRDCFVIEDPGCARGVVERGAQTNFVAYVAVDPDKRGVMVSWLGKGQAPASRHEECLECTDAMLHERVIASLAQLTGLSVATPTTSKSTTPRRTPEPATRGGLAIGVELGEPTAATAAWFRDKVSLYGGLGTGTVGGAGLSLEVGAQLVIVELADRVPLRVGLGGRLYHHGYQLMSIDELPDTHYGLFGSLNLAFDRGPLQLYAQLAPGVDVARTRSCTLERGPATVCPHAQEAPVFVHFAVGLRWFLGQ